MPSETRATRLFSLRVKLLAALIPLTVISMLLAMAGLGKFLQDFFQRRAELETEQVGLAVKSALRQSMLRRPELFFSDTLVDVQKTPNIRHVWIIDKSGRVAHASDREMIGKLLDKTRNPTCTVCHSSVVIPETRTFFTRDDTGIPVVRHVSLIENDQACWQCHDSKIRLNGILLLDESTETFHNALWTIQRRLGATGGITLAVLIGITLLVTTTFVERPIRRLLAGVRQLGTGDLAVRIPVRGGDELAELAGSFNQMAGDLGHSLQEIQNKQAELSVVYSILERLTKTIDLGELKEIILQTIIDVLGADRVLLLSNLTSTEAGEVLIRTRDVNRVHRISDIEDCTDLLPDGFPSELASRWRRGELQQPIVTPDRQVAVIPVQVRDARVALLMLKRERPLKHSEANPELLSALAHHIGVAFENAHLYTLAITDELTQLYTLRHFQNRIEECVSRYKRYEQKVGVVMLDLDHFKRINDTWGHPMGDEILRRVARVLLRTIRAVDSAYRCGGEEFAILLPETDSATARLVAERVRQEIAGIQVPLHEGGTVAVTASIGFAVCPDNGVSVQELVAVADGALYEAKRGGRNRVCGSSKQV
jgi:diguanylate cyclase (GGDEF)-like protein